jgi:hypothetical protein
LDRSWFGLECITRNLTNENESTAIGIGRVIKTIVKNPNFGYYLLPSVRLRVNYWILHVNVVYYYRIQ